MNGTNHLLTTDLKECRSHGFHPMIGWTLFPTFHNASNIDSEGEQDKKPNKWIPDSSSSSNCDHPSCARPCIDVCLALSKWPGEDEIRREVEEKRSWTNTFDIDTSPPCACACVFDKAQGSVPGLLPSAWDQEWRAGTTKRRWGLVWPSNLLAVPVYH